MLDRKDVVESSSEDWGASRSALGIGRTDHITPTVPTAESASEKSSAA